MYAPHPPVIPPRPWDSLFSPKDAPLPPNHGDKLVNKPYGQRRNSQCYQLPRWTDDQFRDYIARYWGYCAYIDSRIGRVLKALDDTGQMDDTIVISTTDHGDMVAAHGMIYKLGACGYDELMRVPFLIRYPRAVKTGLAADALVGGVDVLPTILSLCGVQVPPTVQGRSFTNLLQGRVRGFRDVVHTDSCNQTLIVRTKDWKYVSNWKQGDLDELYDMNARPLEMTNLAADPAHAAKVKEMKGLIGDWLKETQNPYAAPVAKAVVSGASDKIILEPVVASFRQGEGKDGQPTAEFDITWKMIHGAPSDAKYWCFIHVVALGPGKAGILTRVTKWPDPPTTEWKERTEQKMAAMAVPIPADLKPGAYEARTGLFDPEQKRNPPMLGGGSVPIGTLRIAKGKDGKIAVTFEPIK